MTVPCRLAKTHFLLFVQGLWLKFFYILYIQVYLAPKFYPLIYWTVTAGIFFTDFIDYEFNQTNNTNNNHNPLWSPIWKIFDQVFPKFSKYGKTLQFIIYLFIYLKYEQQAHYYKWPYAKFNLQVKISKYIVWCESMIDIIQSKLNWLGATGNNELLYRWIIAIG